MAYVYMMSNHKKGTIYIGVTNNLIRRVYEHRNHLIKGFTEKYQLDRLVYFEECSSMIDAIQKEKNLKHYPRKWKINLIEEANANWKDLWQEII